jgi:hypothetical protein
MEVAMPGYGFWIFLMVSLATLAVATKFAVRPAERTLAILRPMCAAAAFATVASFCLGVTNGLMALSNTLRHAADAVALFPIWPTVVGGLAEALMGLVLGSTLLTISWLLVAVGLRRQV